MLNLGGLGPTPLGAAMDDGNTGSSGSAQQAGAGSSSGYANGFTAEAPQGASAGTGGGSASANSGGAAADSSPEAKEAAASTHGDKAPGEMKPGRLASAGRIAADAAANLAQGSWSVAKGAAQQRMEAAQERIAATTGGKIAAAIRGEESAPGALSSGASSGTGSKASDTSGGLAASLRAAASRTGADGTSGAVSEFGNNSLGRRPDKAELAAEVAAFRDSKSA